MDPIDAQMEYSSKDNERVEAMDLLEECWFFDNLLNRGARMLRCHSDPCPTTANFCKEMFETNQDGETAKVREGDKSHRSGLLRTPSLPPCFGRGEGDQVKEKNSKTNSKLRRQSSHKNFSFVQTPTNPSVVLRKEDDHQGKLINLAESKEIEKPSHHSLIRTPSLPPGIGREGVLAEKQSDPRVNKLNRQASLNPSDLLPPRRSSKGIAQSSSRHRPPRNLEGEIDTEGAKEMRRRYLKQMSMKKTRNDLEHEELQGFKDLGFSFDKESLDPTVVHILPGLQEKKTDELEKQENVQRPYLSEAWFVQSCAPPPPVPTWVAKNTGENIKAQIKFWARNVASNVRQEC